jgi:flagellar biosynthesis/type III secretory pathway M-ring protein FliF/YscJ
MESSASGQSTISRWFAQTSVRVLSVAAIVLAILAVLHVNQQRSEAPMKELLQECKLQNREIQKLQLAFGNAGLDEFKVESGVVWVPQASHKQYLAAAAQGDALPGDRHQQSKDQGETANPFLTRAQQENIDHSRRTNQIREMVARLPFVDQAWFEMDRAKRRHAFDTSNRSAVVSIRSAPDTCLSYNQATTIKNMIAGAVAELSAENILVIDLENGLALKAGMDELTDKQRRIHEIAFNQKRFYESRLRELLSDFQDLSISVNVDIKERKLPEPQQVTPIPEAFEPIVRKTILPTAGANGVASIETEIRSPDRQAAPEHFAQSQVQQVAHETRVQLDKQLKVVIEVPAATVFEKLGKPVIAAQDGFQSQEQKTAEIARQTEVKFEQVKAAIVERVLPLFPQNNSNAQEYADSGHSLTVELDPLVNSTDTPPASNSQAIQNFLTKNWPSVAVLGIGLVLLTIVTRRPVSPPPQEELAHANERHAPAASSDSQTSDEAEVRLSQLIEDDPDSAAKIIETWIRDAA